MTVTCSFVGSSIAWMKPKIAPIDAAVPVSTTEASRAPSERRRSGRVTSHISAHAPAAHSSAISTLGTRGRHGSSSR